MESSQQALERYAEMLREVSNPWCFACGRDETQRHPKWHAPWYLQRAHLGAGSGSMLRIQDRRLVNILCPLCHFAHRSKPGEEGVLFSFQTSVPVITNANMLWIKNYRDPRWYDPEAIAKVWVGIPPEPEIPDQFYLTEYAMRRGGDEPWETD